MAYSDGPRGIGGWLIFFLVLRVLGVMFTALSVFSVYLATTRTSFNPETLKWVLLQSFGIGALIIGADLYMFCSFLWSHRWRTVQIGIVLLGLQALPRLPSLRVFFYRAELGSVGAIFAITPVLVAVASAAIWSLYLLRSKRVANTYQRHGTVDRGELTGVFE